jgi:hypothetical protein
VRVQDRAPPGLAWSQGTRWKHRHYSAEALAERKRVRELLSRSRDLLKAPDRAAKYESNGLRVLIPDQSILMQAESSRRCLTIAPAVDL